MISASADFITAVGADSRHFAAKIYHGGSEVSCDIISLTTKKGAQDGQTFTAGSVFSSSAEITCSNLSAALENEDIELKIGVLTDREDDTYEWITYGKYTVIKAHKTAYQTVLSCVGYISSKFKAILPDMTGTPTIAAVASAIQTATGVTVSFPDISSGTTNALAKGLTGLTCRGALSVIAFAMGGFATENASGGVEIHQFTIPSSTYALSSERCLTPPVVSEEEFDMTGIKVITASGVYLLTTDTSVVSDKIYYERTGSGTDDDPYIYREVESPTGNPSSQGWYELGETSYESGSPIRQTYESEYISQTVFNTLASALVGLEFAPAEINMSLGDPRLEPWDCITVTDIDGTTTHTVPCHLIESTFDGGFSSAIQSIGESETDTGVEGTITEQVRKTMSDLAATRTVAITAQMSANGKNKIYRGSSQPTGSSLAKGDVWFDTAHDNKIHRYNGSSWAAVLIGDDALDTFSANHITAGTIDASQVTVSNLDAGNITTGTIDADRIDASTLTIGGSGLATQANVSSAVDGVQVGGRNLLLNSRDFNGWKKGAFDSNITFSGEECTISVSGKTANFYAGPRGAFAINHSEVVGKQMVLSFDIYSSDWSSVTDSNSTYSGGLDSFAVEVITYTNPITNINVGTGGPYMFKRLGSVHASFWKVHPSAVDNEWLHFESVPFVLPDDYNSDTSKTIQEYVYFYPHVRMNGTVKLRHVKIEFGNKSTDWTPAPEDSTAQEQRVYYRSNSTSAPAAPSTWVTSTATANTTWTTKRMQYDSTYKYLYTCIQRKTVGGAIDNSTVLLDDTTTVIDGGSIITGSVLANAIKADSGQFNSALIPNLSADKISTGTIQIDRMPTGTLNSEIEVGGRNLLLATATANTWTISLNDSNYQAHDCYKAYSPLPSLFEVDDLVTISFDWTTTATAGFFRTEAGKVTPYNWGTLVSATGTRNSTSNYVDISSSNQSGHVTVTYKITSNVVSAASTLEWFRIRVDGADTNGKTFTVSNAKAERGNKATDWTPAPEDVESEINAKASSHILKSASNGASISTILGYAAEGNNVSYVIDTTATPITDVKVGDTVRLAYKVTDVTGTPYVYILGKVVQLVDSTHIKLEGHGLDTTVIDGGMVVTGKVAANRIDANSLVIGDFSQDVQNAFGNDKISISGRNLHKDSLRIGTSWGINNGTNSSGTVTLNRTNAETRVYQLPANGYWTWEANTTYVASIEAKANTAGHKLQFACNGGGTVTYDAQRTISLTTSWKRYACVFTTGSSVSTGSMSYQSITDNSTIQVRNPKLEKGNKATDWAPAPEDVDASIYANSENLLQDTDEPSIDKVSALYNRYFTNSSNTSITATFQPVTGLPDGSSSYVAQFVSDGTHTATKNRGLAFYNTTGNVIPLTYGNTYTAIWWARFITTTGHTSDRANVRFGYTHRTSTTDTYAWVGATEVTTDWKRYVVTFTPTSPRSDDLHRVIFDAQFLAGKYGTVQMCGFRLIEGENPEDAAKTATSYITTVDNTGIMVHPSGDSTSGWKISSVLELLKSGVTYIKAWIESNVPKIQVGRSDGGNVLIDDDSVDIRKGSTVLSTFTANGASLGANSVDATVDLCDAAGKLSAARLAGSNRLSMDVKGTSAYGGARLTLNSTTTNEHSSYIDMWITDEDDYNNIELRAYDSGGGTNFSVRGGQHSVLAASGYSNDQAQLHVYSYNPNCSGSVFVGVGKSGDNHGIYSNTYDKWIIYADGGGYVRVPLVYEKTTTQAANVYVAVGDTTKGRLFRSTSSSKRYKKDIEDIENAEALYEIPVRQFKYRDDYLSDDDNRFNKTVVGFIAEEMEEVYPIAVEYEDELAEDWNVRYLVPPMLKLIQDQKKEIDELKQRIEALERR